MKNKWIKFLLGNLTINKVSGTRILNGLVLTAGLVMMVAFIIFRLNSYGPWGYSMSTMDTDSYLTSAKIPTFSYEFLTSLRSPSYPLLLKILGPVDQYKITKISIPYNHAEGQLVNQPGFDRVVIFQTWVSIFCWCFLAGVIFFRLRNGWVRLFAMALVLVFGFSPQMADWDSLIMTESLSFSLFALLLGLMIEMAFCFIGNSALRRLRTWLILSATILVTVFWVFLRDTNVYFIPVSLVFIAGLLVLSIRKWKEVILPVALFFAVMIGILILQQNTFRASERWLVPFYNNMTRGIFPYPLRVAYFEKYGMPVSDKLLGFRGSQPLESPDAPADFVAWAKQNGLTVYTRFITEHPGYVVLSLWEDMDSLWDTNIQPYFYQSGSQRPDWLISYSNYLNPVIPLPLFLDGLFALVLFYVAIQQRDREMVIWAWVTLWLYITSVALLVLGYAGEMRSVLRHVMGGVVPLRLGLWILTAILIDLFMSPRENPKIEGDQPVLA